MGVPVIAEALKQKLLDWLKKHRKADLLTSYFFFLEQKYQIHPVLFFREKTIYQSCGLLLQLLEEKGKLYREKEIKIQVGSPVVNAQTKKIYICPFTGKVFGDNTHANPQDEIYDWVSKCPENQEYVDGLKVKRFFVSEDPEIIKNYITESREPISKLVFSSGLTGKLFNSKEAVIEDFKQNHIKEVQLSEVPGQNRFHIEDQLMTFIENQLDEEHLVLFIDALSQHPEFAKHIKLWVEESKELSS